MEAEANRLAETEQQLNAELDLLRKTEAAQVQRIAEAEAESRRLAEDAVRLQTEEAHAQQQKLEQQQRTERLEVSRNAARLEAQQRSEKIESLKSDLAALSELEVEQSNQIQKAVARLAAAEEKLQLMEAELQRRAAEENQRLAELDAIHSKTETEAPRRAEEAQKLNAEIETLQKTQSEQLQRIAEAQAESRRLAEEAVPVQTDEEARQQAEAEAARQHVELEARLLSELESLQAREEQDEQGWPGKEMKIKSQMEPLETWQFPLSDELAAVNGLEQSAQPLEEIPKTIPQGSQPKAETGLELELQAELSRVEVAASPSQTARQEVAKSSDLVPTEEVSGDESKISDLVENLKSSDPAKRSMSIQKLAELDEDEAFYLIAGLFDDNSTGVRNAAALALYEIKPYRVASFTRAFREASAERRLHIAAALNGSGLAAQAIQSLTGADREKTYDAFSILFLMAKAGEVEMLLQTIEKHPDTAVQLSVIKLLTFCNQPEIIPAFRSLAIRGALSTKVRSAVMAAIYQISSIAREKSLSVA
jgi:hypothetical protein